jgi:asparagine synthase (glutamine-hydrolysing)
MCGFVGVFGSGRPEVPIAACRILAHRGPDDEGSELGTGWALGFRRLSILDLSPSGHQPMANADGSCRIVFNGEAYNYVELRKDLEAQGETFRGTSDTEVVLSLLAARGAAALPLLNGMFALAFVDLRSRRFLLARDRLGVKPLYLQREVGTLRFASELKALLSWPDARRELDREAVATYFALGYLPSDVCIFQGYEKLAPGSLIEGSLDDPGSARCRRWWGLTVEDAEGSDEELEVARLDELDALLADATRIRLRSDVPVGVFLSGGIDSGLVASYAAEAGAGNPPTGLTIGWKETGFDETDLAALTARRVGLPHNVIPQGAASLGTLDRMSWFYDEPFADSSALPTFALCEAARGTGIVFLAGDGGDEAFGGYHRYLGAAVWGWLGRVPEPVKAMGRAFSRLLPATSGLRYRLLKACLPDDGFAAAFDAIPQDPALGDVLHPEIGQWIGRAAARFWDRWAASRGRGVLARQQQLDYDLYLPDDILVKVDRASMAHSIELRSPFLDYRVVEWAARLPRRQLLRDGVGKLPLRRLAARRLPADVAIAEKKGFGVPFEEWLRDPRKMAFVRERLKSTESARQDLWNVDGVSRLLDRAASARGRDDSSLVWKILVFDAWARQFLSTSARV